MRNNTIILATLFLTFILVNAQNTFECGTDEIRLAKLNDPDFALSEQLKEAKIQEIIKNKKLRRNSTEAKEKLYRIPVVFHIIDYKIILFHLKKPPALLVVMFLGLCLYL